MTRESTRAALIQLLALQRTDAAMDTLERDRAGIPGAKQRLQEAVEAATRAHSELKQELDAEELEHRRLEAELGDAEALIQRLEGQSGNVASNQAYTALLHEIDQAKEKISQCEDGVLTLLERIDLRREELRSAEVLAQTARDAEVAEIEELARREEELGRELIELSTGRGEQADAVDPKVLRQYESIGRRFPVRVATLTKKACSGCRIVIPAQRCMEIKSLQEISVCPQCERILVTELLIEELQNSPLSP